MDEQLFDAFVEQVNCSLGFLSERYGFSEPEAQLDRRAAAVTVTFVKGGIAIEATYDLREGDVELKMVRLEDGRKPDGYHVDRQGRRFRANLVEILMDRGVRNFGLRRPEIGEESRDQRLKRLLDRYASLLESHGHDILAGSAAAFDSLGTRRDRPNRKP